MDKGLKVSTKQSFVDRLIQEEVEKMVKNSGSVIGDACRENVKVLLEARDQIVWIDRDHTDV